MVARDQGKLTTVGGVRSGRGLLGCAGSFLGRHDEYGRWMKMSLSDSRTTKVGRGLKIWRKPKGRRKAAAEGVGRVGGASAIYRARASVDTRSPRPRKSPWPILLICLPFGLFHLSGALFYLSSWALFITVPFLALTSTAVLDSPSRVSTALHYGWLHAFPEMAGTDNPFLALT